MCRLVYIVRADAWGGDKAQRKEDEKFERENQKGTRDEMQATDQDLCETK